MDGVDAYQAGASVGLGGLAHADGIAHRSRLGEADAAGLVVRALAQVVQVRDRKLGQTFIARVAIDGVGALQEVRDGRTADVLVRPVHLHQQLHISAVYLRAKGTAGARYRLASGCWATRLSAHRATKRLSWERLYPLVRRSRPVPRRGRACCTAGSQTAPARG